MKRILTILTCLILIQGNMIYSQDEFKPSGKPTAKVFTNFLYDVSENQSAFQLTRAYLGYNYNLSENFSTNITFDVGSPEVDINDSVTVATSFDYTAFLKIASITYKKDKLQIDAGMVGLVQMKYQEQYWNHRYIYKSFQDVSKMGTTADLGTVVTYKFADFFSADLTIRNGEGFKNIENDNALRSAIGLTFTPFIKGFIIRGFYDYIEKQEAQFVFAHMIGYQNEKLSIGGEYNIELNSNDKKEHTLQGTSLYASVNLSDKTEVFGRYDFLTSNKVSGAAENWNLSKDGSTIIAGVQYSLLKKVQLALDYQGFMPKDEDKDMTNLIFLHLQFSY